MSLVPRHIKELPIYKPGLPIEEVRRELGLDRIIKLSSNENPYGSSPKALDAVKNTLIDNSRYPDAMALSLRERLAERFDLKVENVVVGAGSEGIMSSIMRTFLRHGDEIIAAENSFIGFRILAKSTAIRTNWIYMDNFHHDLSAMAEAINDYTKIIYLANPDNPTGTYFTVEAFDSFMEQVPPQVLVILDEAYFEYAQHLDDYPDSMHYRYDNVITLRTFSKAHGLAGFRVGYGFAHKNLIENLNKVKLPFEPSSPAQVAALTGLDDESYIQQTVNKCRVEKKKLMKVFQEMHIEFIPSAANFLTLVFKGQKEAVSFNDEMLHRGVILRHLSGWGLPHCIRLTVGTEEENVYFLQQLSSILQTS